MVSPRKQQVRLLQQPAALQQVSLWHADAHVTLQQSSNVLLCDMGICMLQCSGAGDGTPACWRWDPSIDPACWRWDPSIDSSMQDSCCRLISTPPGTSGQASHKADDKCFKTLCLSNLGVIDTRQTQGLEALVQHRYVADALLCLGLCSVTHGELPCFMQVQEKAHS